MAQLPEKIFKYINSERIDILEKLLIRFTQPLCFNDPFEMRIPIEGYTPEKIDAQKERLNRIMHRQLVLTGGNISYEEFRRIQNNHNQAAIDQLKFDRDYQKLKATEHEFKKWNEKVGILSFSAAEKNLLMWAHYADSHRGMLIEFNPKHSFFNGSNPSDGEYNFGMLTKVNYEEKRPKANIETTSQIEILPMIKTKSDEWIKEQEWRVYQLLENRDEETTKGDETVCLFKLPPDCIKRVVVGYNMDYLNRKRVINAVNANSKLKRVKVEQSVLHLDLFGLEYQPLPQIY
jgi:hypothetical protein